MYNLIEWKKNQYDIRLHRTLRWCVTLSYSGRDKDVLADVRVSKSTAGKVGYCWRLRLDRATERLRPKFLQLNVRLHAK